MGSWLHGPVNGDEEFDLARGRILIASTCPGRGICFLDSCNSCELLELLEFFPN